MRYTTQFNDFDPLTGIIPSHLLGGHLREISDRARSVLKGRTVKELDSAAQFIDWVIDVHIEELGDGVESGDGELPERSDHHDVEWFKQCAGKLSFSNNKDFANGNYNHYFAVLALWLVIDALTSVGSTPTQYPAPKPDLSEATEYAIQAMEAICIADEWDIVSYWHRRSEGPIRAVKKQSEAGTKAAKTKHEKDNLYEWRKLAIEQYHSDKYKGWTIPDAAVPIAEAVGYSEHAVIRWLRADKYKHKK